MNTVITNASSHLKAFEIKDVKPLRLMSGDKPLETESPRNILRNGRTILCDACATPCPAAITEAQ